MAVAAKAPSGTGDGRLSRRTWWSDHRPHAAIVALSTLFIAIVWSGLLFYRYERNQATLARAEQNGANFAIVLEEQVERTFLGIDQVMRFVQAAYQADPAGFDLRSWVDRAPFLRPLSLQISMANAKGDIVASNLNVAPGARTNIADRAHFRVHAEQSQAGLFVSRPVLGRVSQRWSIQLSRRLSAPDGSLAGVLVVSLDPDYLTGLFDTLDLGPGGSVTLYGQDGYVRAQMPSVAGMFERRLDMDEQRPVLCPGQSGWLAGTCRMAGSGGGSDRILSYRALELPLVIAVGQSTAAIEASLQGYGHSEYGLAALLTLGLVAALFFLLRQLERRLEREEELRESQARLKANSAHLAATLDNIDQGLMMIDPEGRIQVCNRRAVELLGLPQALIDTRPHFTEIQTFQLAQGEFGDADFVPTQWDPLSLAPGTAFAYERQRPDGRILEIRTVRLDDSSAVRTYTDVTDQRQGEIALRESEERYRTIAEHLPQKVWMIKPDGTALYFNRAMIAYHGALGPLVEDRADLFHPDDAARARNMRERCFATESAFTIEVRLKRHDGAFRWHYMTLIPLKRDGRVFEWVGTSLDIDDIRQAEAKLRASEERLAFALDASTDGLWDWDVPSGTLWFSERWQTMLGFEPGELPEKLSSWENLVHPDDMPVIRSMLEAHLEGSIPLYDAELRVRCKNGTWIWVRDRGKVVARDPKGRPLRMVGTQTDIHARKQAESAAEAARIQAERESEAKTEFLASMSHEIRTPLNSILGFTGLILDRPRLDPDVQRQVQLIQGSGAALLTIVNDILDFSKIEAGQIDLDPRPFGIEALVGNTMSIVRGLAGAKRLDIRAAIDPGISAWLVGDEDRLRQILLNFLNNAIKFTREGWVDLSVGLVASAAAGDRIRFAVTDTGIGIPKAKQNRLFQRFSQVDGSIRREFGGTGLGLAISKRLVELMDGTIGVESRECEGSTFWFEVVLPRGERGAGLIPSAAPRTAARPARILLAEDVEVNQEIARAVLEAAGHHVDVVSDGSEAIMAVQGGHYDVVLMDVQMPVVDGVMATQRIREFDGPSRHVPIIAMTANVLPDQIAKFRQAGMSGHVGKPFKREELYDAIERALHSDGTKARSKTPPSTASSIDQATFDGLLAVMGDAGVRRLMERLEPRLRSVLRQAAEGGENREQLAREAHALVSAAGMLGFLKLSQLLRELEAACLAGADLAPEFGRVQGAVELALGEIAALKEAA